MKKTKALVITGVTGIVGSLTGAVITRKLYKDNKEAIENKKINNKKEILKAKLKTGLAATGTTILAGLAIASGAAIYVDNKEHNNNYDNDDNNYDNDDNNEIDYEENKEWIDAVKSTNKSYNEEKLEQIDSEINEFVESIEKIETKIYESNEEEEEDEADNIKIDKIEDILDILDNTKENIDTVKDIVEEL